MKTGKNVIKPKMKLTRIQFEVEEDKLKEIEELQEAIGARTRTDLFNYALTLLKWALEEEEKGRIIASIDEEAGKYKQIEIPRIKRFMGKQTKATAMLIRRKEKKRILIVDDDEMVAQLMKEILQGQGFETEVARDSMEGLEKIKHNKYDVIISDCGMAQMRGDKLYPEVQKLSQDLAKRIIFISGNINNFIRSTGNRFLAKPFSHQQLIEVVNDLIADVKGKG